jgi:hypothetical protein
MRGFRIQQRTGYSHDSAGVRQRPEKHASSASTTVRSRTCARNRETEYSPAVTPAKNDGENPPPGMIAEKAGVGSGDKGRGYGEGVVATPVATYFAARERIMFTIQIPELLRAYKFEHDMKGPKSNEEFMKEVIKKHGIELPTLPRDHKYWYDAKDGELKVLRPN